MASFFSRLSQWSVLSLLVLLAVPVTPLPAAVSRDTTLDAVLKIATSFLNGIQTAILEQVNDIITIPSGKYTITQNSQDPILRAAGIATKKATFLYGPPVAGGPAFPAGAYGTLRVALDQAFIQEDLVPELALAVADAAAAVAGLPKVLRIEACETLSLSVLILK
jgi:hypothetical protein